ncbi:hypothetical protein NCCP1664_20910 [Zafaria cholistanensis]|uniref:Uncharacterized protein n=1 Tax=Zafaria cholistanensis TaxID=1682741 RepID=A0A5A7NSL7_9MICC|nr:hypothetical protein NCCP1664_20910 [Zafaria cholistanensis]
MPGGAAPPALLDAVGFHIPGFIGGQDGVPGADAVLVAALKKFSLKQEDSPGIAVGDGKAGNLRAGSELGDLQIGSGTGGDSGGGRPLGPNRKEGEWPGLVAGAEVKLSDVHGSPWK